MTLRGCGVLLGLALLAGCTQAPAAPKDSRSFSFWPEPPAKPRIQFLVSYDTSADIIPPRGGFDNLVIGKDDEDPVLALNKPYGVHMAGGCIYLCDTRNNCIAALDLRRKEVRLIGSTGQGRLTKPIDITVSPDGMKYVADTGKNAVYVFDSADRFVRTFTLEDWKPVGVAVRGDELYVANMGANRIDVLNRATGAALRTIGEPGTEDGQLGGPLGIDVDKEGNIYVSEMLNCRVQKFSPEGKSLLCFGAQGDQHGNFVRPKHLAVDSAGIVYVVDAAFQNVQMFDPEGQLLMSFGEQGEHLGAMDLPAGICATDGDLDLFKQYLHPSFQAERLIVVTNQFGPHKVSVYAFGREKEGGKVIGDR